MECIYQGFHKSLDSPETRNLALQVLDGVYGLYEKDIFSSSLNAFESWLEKVFGKATSDTILNALANECADLRHATCDRDR